MRLVDKVLLLFLEDAPSSLPKNYTIKFSYKKSKENLAGQKMVYMTVTCFYKGDQIGHADFSYDENNQDDGIVPRMVEIDKEHRGKGLASFIYRAVEKKTGLVVRPNSMQTASAKRLWKRLKAKE